MNIYIYCSGGIKKGNEDKKICWTNLERMQLENPLNLYNVIFLEPDGEVPKLEDKESQFGRDMYQISMSDFVVVDARQRRGIGIGTEMMASKVLNKPLVVVAPRNTHYRAERLEYRGIVECDYIHPHLASLSDAIVESFEEAGEWIKGHVNGSYKNINTIQHAINCYKERVFPEDKYMVDIVDSFKNCSQ